jgi:hypothetical protein
MTMSELLERVKELGRAKDRYWWEEVYHVYPTFPFKPPSGEEPPVPPSEVALECLLRSLPEADLYTLFALMRLGQGRFPAAEFDARREALRQSVPVESVLVEMLQGAYLPADLIDAAARLRKVGKKIEDLQLTPV